MIKAFSKSRFFMPTILFAGGFTYNVTKKNFAEQEKIQLFKQADFEKYKKDKPKYELKKRSEHLQEALKNQYDVLIVGGGCNGSGVLIEGANRGLKCLMVEEYDFSSGASSKSTKLIHGGLRYLAQVFEFSLEGARWEKFKLITEALHERCYMVDNAYYMNKVLPLVIPCTNFINASYNYVGTIMYHLVYKIYPTPGASTVFHFPRWMGNDELRANFPHLDLKYRYGIVYYDGQMNDTRMNMDTILTSTLDNYKPNFVGANILNYTKFIDFIKDSTGHITGAKLLDKTTNEEFEIKAKTVINCAGVFADKIRKLNNPNVPKRIVASQGAHITFPMKMGSRKNALLISKTVDGRILFVIPWLDHVLVGTTDGLNKTPIIDPNVKQNEMEFLIKEMARIYPDMSYDYIMNNVKSRWAGLRPLVFENAEDESKINSKQASRKHVIEKTDSGLFSLMGGKWTIYRKMGEETIDEVQKYLLDKKMIKEEQLNKRNSKSLKLLGSFEKDDHQKYPMRKSYIRFYANKLQEQYNLKWNTSKYLIKNYGERAFDILFLTKEDQSLKDNISYGHPYIKAEILYHIRNEMVVKPNDVLLRRTRIGTLDQNLMEESIPKVIDIFAKELNWDEDRKQKELTESLQELDRLRTIIV